MGVGLGEDTTELVKILKEHKLEESDYTIIEVDLVSYSHASQSVRKVQDTGVEEIQMSSVDIISAPWVNGLTYDKDRPILIQALI